MAETYSTEEPQQPAMTSSVTAQSRYEELVTLRNPYEARARECATLTIPSLIPPQGTSGATPLPAPWQGIGARGVNNLAAKLLLALFPPNGSFFKLSIAENVVTELKQQAQDTGEDVVGQMEKALSQVERAAQKKLEGTNLRSIMSEASKHLIVAGNCLLHIESNISFKFFPLTSYVVKRDLSGNVLEIITKECLSPRSLPVEARAIVAQHKEGTNGADSQKSLELFTWITRKDNGTFRVHQEICGYRIPGTEGFYPKNTSAWIPLRWTAVAGEDYGRAHCDEYLGDLLSVEALSKALVDLAAGAARTVFCVNPAGTTQRKDLENARNLSVIEGDAKDVSVIRVDKIADFQVAKAEADKIERRLEQAFLLTSSIQRDAERVTAEEIRMMAGELEQTLGGVYSTLSQEWQRPLADRVLFQMQRAGLIPRLPKEAVNPEIITGLEGLGRMTDYQKLQLLVTDLGTKVGPEALAEYLNVGAYLTRGAAALNMDIDGLVRSEEQVQLAREQKAQQALAQSLGPQAIQANAKRDVAAMQGQAGSQPAAATP